MEIFVLKRKLKTFYHTPRVLIKKIWNMFEPFVSDEFFLKVSSFISIGYWPNFKNPKTFNDKIQWLKLNYRKKEYTKMVDKVAAKDYVAGILGNKYIIPTLGVWNSIDEVDWKELPNQFVIKATHDSGGVVICKDKATFNIEEAISLLKGAGKKNYARFSKEYVYYYVPHRFLAEKFMLPSDASINDDLSDYKFYCFNGEPKYCQVIRDRNTKETIDFYDMEWKHMDFVGLNIVAKNGTKPVPCPKKLDEMIGVCRNLSKNIPFVRVDLYVIDGNVYFGEITFYPASGLGLFTPAEWNLKLGEMIKLPSKV